MRAVQNDLLPPLMRVRGRGGGVKLDGELFWSMRGGGGKTRPEPIISKHLNAPGRASILHFFLLLEDSDGMEDDLHSLPEDPSEGEDDARYNLLSLVSNKRENTTRFFPYVKIFV